MENEPTSDQEVPDDYCGACDGPCTWDADDYFCDDEDCQFL